MRVRHHHLLNMPTQIRQYVTVFTAEIFYESFFGLSDVDLINISALSERFTVKVSAPPNPDGTKHKSKQSLV